MSVTIYTKQGCPYCVRALALLREKGVTPEEIRIDEFPHKRLEMETRSHRHTVPQIFIDEVHVGGCDDLLALDASGELDTLLLHQK